MVLMYIHKTASTLILEKCQMAQCRVKCFFFLMKNDVCNVIILNGIFFVGDGDVCSSVVCFFFSFHLLLSNQKWHIVVFRILKWLVPLRERLLMGAHHFSNILTIHTYTIYMFCASFRVSSLLFSFSLSVSVSGSHVRVEIPISYIYISVHILFTTPAENSFSSKAIFLPTFLCSGERFGGFFSLFFFCSHPTK